MVNCARCSFMGWTLPPDQAKFFAGKPASEAFAPVGGWGSHFDITNPWASPPAPKAPYKPDFADDESLKRRFGVELGKHKGNAFVAGCQLFPDQPNMACWVSDNWLSDPIVEAAKDIYLSEVRVKDTLLDKDAFAAMLLDTAARMEDRERVNLLKLYSDVRGFTGKNEITNNNFANNEGLKVVFVKSETKSNSTVINNSLNVSEMTNDQELPFKVKLVSSGS